MKIGIMGGTFDPPHLGHIVPVEVAAAEFGLDLVWFVPSFIPPHKNRPDLTEAYHRAAMVAIALQPYPQFRLSPEELATGTVRFTVDTIADWMKGLNANDRLFFIMGSDSFLELETWREYQRLLQLCDFIIINRGGVREALKSKLEQLERALQLSISHSIHFAKTSHLPVSSTEIRSAVQQGRRVHAWLPAGVEEYIKKHSLYQRR